MAGIIITWCVGYLTGALWTAFCFRKHIAGAK